MTTNIGLTFFNKNESNNYFKNGFLVLKKFDTESSPTSTQLDNYIFNLDNQSRAVIFSPKGSLYLVTLTNGSIPSNFDVMFPNPLTSGENYSSNYRNWQPLNYTTYVKYNPSLPYPQFFSSLPFSFGSNAVGSGFLLYREKPFDGTPSNYYLLHNPFNRPMFGDKTAVNSAENFGLLDSYCKAIQYQDAMCYCRNTLNNKHCVYAVAGSEQNGQGMLNLVSSPKLSSSASNAIQQLQANCACNSICQQWAGYNTLTDKPACASTFNNVFCDVNLSASDQGVINASGFKSAQNCSSNDTSNRTIAGINVNSIYIAIAIAVVMIIISFFLLQ